MTEKGEWDSLNFAVFSVVLQLYEQIEASFIATRTAFAAAIAALKIEMENSYWFSKKIS